MEKSKIFIRGQIWYWEDPIYGAKTEGKQINIGEQLERYSRYVIITQTTNTIDTSNILVIPCSTSNIDEYNVLVPITSNIFHSCSTYAVPRKIFPIHPATLTNYVCMLPEEYMKRIEANLLKILSPSVSETFSKDEFKELCGIDMNFENENLVEDADPSLTHVSNFIKECIQYSPSSSPISIFEIKDAFNDYCEENHLPGIDDIVKFMGYFTFRMDMDSARFLRIVNFKKVSFEHIKITSGHSNKSKEVIDKKENKDNKQSSKKSSTLNTKKNSNKIRWTDIDKLEFIRFYLKNGMNETMKKYNLPKKTIYNYNAKWKRYFNERGINYTKYEGDLPDTRDVKFTVSIYSNIIADQIILEHNKELSNFSNDDSHLSIIISSCIYHTILDHLCIKNHDRNQEGIPKISQSSNTIFDYVFFDNFNKGGLRTCKTYKEICKRYEEQFHLQTLSMKWVTKASYILSKRLKIDKEKALELFDVMNH